MARKTYVVGIQADATRSFRVRATSPAAAAEIAMDRAARSFKGIPRWTLGFPGDESDHVRYVTDREGRIVDHDRSAGGASAPPSTDLLPPALGESGTVSPDADPTEAPDGE